MPVCEIEPLQDPRWRKLVDEHPRASVFHTVEWLRALRETYGYQPVVFTTTAAGVPLANGIVFCRVRSWLTGSRLVSLPFSDHCEPLTASAEETSELLRYAAERETKSSKYIELRPREPLRSPVADLRVSAEFYLHLLSLERSPQELFDRLQRDSVQRKIRRAEREGLQVESGQSLSLLREFYRLLVQTRRRHYLPPQPFAWFANLVRCFAEKSEVMVASHNGQPVAGIFTLQHGAVLTYKYGGADHRFQAMGGMQLLLWRATVAAQERGLKALDLGRTDLWDEGLATFKDRWGAQRRKVSYYRTAAAGQPPAAGEVRGPRRMLKWLPSGALVAIGKLVYRHLG